MMPRIQHLGIAKPTGAIKPLGRIGAAVEAHARAANYIDYILYPKFCPMIEHNYTKRFYALLDRIIDRLARAAEGLNGL